MPATATPCLKEEAKHATFDVQAMKQVIYGSQENLQLRQWALEMIERDPYLFKKNFFDLTMNEDKKITMRQLRRSATVRNKLRQTNPKLLQAFDRAMEQFDRTMSMRLYVHETLFRETIWGQGTEEQYAKYKKAIDEMSVIGCFAMTELGHSSFLRGLETTATFDKKNQEFVIHTPALSGAKWWIGMAGETSTHTVALCKVVVDNVEYGLHWFIVPMRNPEDGTLLPGVTAGVIGPKMGRNGLDNGYIMFSQVRVPRDNMLMRWGSVSKEGKYSAPATQVASYAPLIGERIVGLSSIFDEVAQAVTIATRYTARRIQGAKNEKVLDYQGIQTQLMPILSGCYALAILSRVLEHSWTDVQNNQVKIQNLKEFTKQVHDHHAIAAGLKAYIGWWGMNSLELCRRAMGGHGYSSYNAIAGLIGDYGVITTGGGDNIVLAQQNAGYLLTKYRKSISGENLKGTIAAHIMGANNFLQQNRQCRATKMADFLDTGVLLETVKWLSVAMVTKVGAKLAEDITLHSTSEAANENMNNLLEVSCVNTAYYVIDQFYIFINSVTNEAQKKVLKQMADLFALDFLRQKLGLFLIHGFVSAKQGEWITTLVNTLSKEVRKNAVALTDAFDFPDWIIKAPLGSAKGDMYENYFNVITSSPNHVNTATYWKEEVAPMLAKL